MPLENTGHGAGFFGTLGLEVLVERVSVAGSPEVGDLRDSTDEEAKGFRIAGRADVRRGLG